MTDREIKQVEAWTTGSTNSGQSRLHKEFCALAPKIPTIVLKHGLTTGADYEGELPLHYALRNNHADIVLPYITSQTLVTPGKGFQQCAI